MAKRKTPRGKVTESGRQYAEERDLGLNNVKGLLDADVSGLIIVEDNTAKILEALPIAIARGLESVGLVAEGYAKKLCPVDTGRLRNSITHTIDGDEQAAYIGTNVEYGRYVEFGTSRSKAQPFLRPAAQDHATKYREIIETSLKNA